MGESSGYSPVQIIGEHGQEQRLGLHRLSESLGFDIQFL